MLSGPDTTHVNPIAVTGHTCRWRLDTGPIESPATRVGVCVRVGGGVGATRSVRVRAD